MSRIARPPELNFTKITLANGLDVIARRQGPLPIVAVNLWYHVGSKDEDRRGRGFAHLFEHLMFEGSLHYPGDFFKPLQRVGAGVNGSTSTDRTNYYIDLPAAHVELALAMESDRMGFLLPALSDQKLRVQKDVVKNEYRQNYANRPYGQVSRILAEALYPPDHPYSWTTIGDMDDVEAATRDDVEAFFRRYYVPNNASLCLVGDIDEDRALALAERYFGPLPPGVGSIRRRCPDPSLPASRSLTLPDRVELERIYESWHTVPMLHPDDAPLAMLGDVLARGQASRLYRKLVVERQIAQGVSAQTHARELAGTFHIVATIRPDRSDDEARSIILAELEAIASRGVDDHELDRAQSGRVAGFIYALDNVGKFGGVADRLNAYNIYTGDPGRINSDVDRFLAVTPADLQRVAVRYLVDQPRVSLLVTGRANTRTVVDIDRASAPAPGAARPFQAPVPEIRTLRCGSPLWVLPRRDLPIVAATAVVIAGSGSHGPDQGGLADLTAAMMDQGTAGRSAYEIAFGTESLGTHLSTSCGFDGSYVSMQCLSGHLEASLDLTVDVLRAPSFPAEEWRRVQGQALAALRAERDRAEALAHRAFLASLFPSDHPFRLPVDGSAETVGRLSRDDLEAFHRDRYGPAQCAWVVAGDVEADEVAALLDQRLDGWEGALPTTLDLPETRDPNEPRILLIDRPGAPQAVVRVGHSGIPRRHVDFTDILVFNQILGGQFSSRLNENLRETKGYTYGIRSHFDFRRTTGVFTIAASLEAGRLAEAMNDLRAEVLALLEDRPPTEQELDDARRCLIEGQARHFETPSALVARMAGLHLHDLPPDEHQRFAERVASVSTTSALEAGRRLIRPESLIYVVVADAKATLPALERLGWAAVQEIAPVA